MRQPLALAVFALAVALFVYTAFVGTASPATTWVTFGALVVLFGLAAFLAAPHKKERKTLFNISALHGDFGARAVAHCRAGRNAGVIVEASPPIFSISPLLRKLPGIVSISLTPSPAAIPASRSPLRRCRRGRKSPWRGRWA